MTRPFLPTLFFLATTISVPCRAQEPPAEPPGDQTDHHSEHHGDHHWGGHRQNADRLFISPMGEPFRGDGGRASLIAGWFAGADINHDGKLSLAEFRADAARFFLTLDTNNDGEIDPDEITHYENEIAPEIRSGGYMGGGGGHRGGGGHGGGGGGHGGGGHGGGGHRHGGQSGDDSGEGGGSGGMDSPYEGGQGAGRFAMLDIPEPVASADADFNRGVSRAEFLHAATERFQALDVDHHGQLTLEELPQHPPKVEHHQSGGAPDVGI